MVENKFIQKIEINLEKELKDLKTYKEWLLNTGGNLFKNDGQLAIDYSNSYKYIANKVKFFKNSLIAQYLSIEKYESQLNQLKENLRP